jgi:hypothetical protein
MYSSNIPEVQYVLYSMYSINIPENRLHETVDNLLAGLDQLFRRLSVDLSEGRRMSCRRRQVLLPALVKSEPEPLEP